MIPLECVWNISHYLPASVVRYLFKTDDKYWHRRYKYQPKLQSNNDVFLFMKREIFHPLLIQVLSNYNLFAILTENKIPRGFQVRVLTSTGRHKDVLKYAAKNNNLLVELLETNPKEMYEEFQKILCHAAIKESVLNVLIRKGYNLNIYYLDSCILLDLIEMDKLMVVDWNIGSVNDRGMTPLQHLINHDRYEICIQLLDVFRDRCDTNWVNNNGSTALMMLCSAQFTTASKEQLILKLINEYDCNPYCASSRPTAYIGALMYRPSIACLMLEKWGPECIGPDPLMNIIETLTRYENIISAVSILIEKHPEKCLPAKIYEHELYGRSVRYTALTRSIGRDQSDVVIMLIDKFGDECCPGLVIDGYTLLELAIINRRIEIALKLLETFGEGCNVNHICEEGNAFITLIKFYYHWNINDMKLAVLKLKEAGCNLRYKDDDEYALDILFRYTNVTEDFLLFLVDCGVVDYTGCLLQKVNEGYSRLVARLNDL